MTLSKSAGSRSFLPLVALLYISQGVPMGLSMEALPVLMRNAGVPLEVIAWVPLAGLPWILKLFWAPLVENQGSVRLGRRRGWLLWMQAVLLVSLLAIGLIPLAGIGIWIALAVLVLGGIASATQDTATDGMVAESLRGAGLAHANALQIGGMMAGFLIGGAGTLMMAEALGQFASMALLALIPLASLLMAWRWREPAPVVEPERARLRQTFRRKGIWRMLGLAAIFGSVQAGGQSISRVLLIDKGWTPAEVGLMATVTGLVLVCLGSPLGSLLAARSRFLTVAGGMAVAAAAFVILALIGTGAWVASWTNAILAGSLLSIASGMIAVSAFTLLMRFGGEGNQAGTDVTVLQSASVTGEMFFAGFAVWCAGTFGYGASLATGAAITGLLAVLVAFGTRFGRGQPRAA
ncbi:MFS transporter [Paracoccus denitrificans]|uniref:MFS transporter n=1 Tax=Paracoccus denitrificans TaxID=266 RepID=UPI001E2C57A7|nr:MFS transporter [Paracoccus denitrificans]UFS67260.1 MFS transporter [Paracoccus denitrificans]